MQAFFTPSAGEIHAVLLDLTLPGLSGTEVFEAVAADVA